MYAYKDLLELAGYATRLYSLFSTLHALPPVEEFERAESVGMEGVSIGVPGGGVGGETEMLVSPLRLRVERGEHLMITGPVRDRLLLLIILL